MKLVTFLSSLAMALSMSLSANASDQSTKIGECSVRIFGAESIRVFMSEGPSSQLKSKLEVQDKGEQGYLLSLSDFFSSMEKLFFHLNETQSFSVQVRNGSGSDVFALIGQPFDQAGNVISVEVQFEDRTAKRYSPTQYKLPILADGTAGGAVVYTSNGLLGSTDRYTLWLNCKFQTK